MSKGGDTSGKSIKPGRSSVRRLPRQFAGSVRPFAERPSSPVLAPATPGRMKALFLLPLAAFAFLAACASAAETTTLDKVTVFAGQFPTGEQPGAVLNALEVVRTPGANADINRALQTLPGIQLPDEGN